MTSQTAAPYIKTVSENDDKVVITDPKLVEQIKSCVGLIGPPGSAKSTLCNTILYCRYGHRVSFYQASDDMESFTKGIWVMSNAGRMTLKGDVNYEPIDMEGFEADKARCWKMAMVMSIFCEVIIFCSRDVRYDTLFKAADVLQKGIKLSKDLGMRPVTSQVFVMVHPADMTNESKMNQIIQKINSIIKGIDVIPFCIPTVPFSGTNFDSVSYHPDVVKAVNEGLVGKFKFSKDAQAAASKAIPVKNLLDAFNTGNLKLCDSQSEKFLKADCERIYAAELCNFKQIHHKRAFSLTLQSIDTNLDSFMGAVDRKINPDFKSSPFFIEGRSEAVISKWYSGQVELAEVKKCYESAYDTEVRNLKAKELAEKATQLMHKEFYNLVGVANNTAASNLANHVSGMKFNDTYIPPRETFIDRSILADIQKKVSLTADYSPFYTQYQYQCQSIKAKWEGQIAKAKWQAPVQAWGEMKCAGGHNLNNIVGCNKCDGTLFWMDGPTRYVMCNKCLCLCVMGEALICALCKQPSACKTRFTSFIP